jgi:hypothetical protein
MLTYRSIGWQFDREGKCIHIPYTDKVPEVAKTRSWPTAEKNDVHVVAAITLTCRRESICILMLWED